MFCVTSSIHLHKHGLQMSLAKYNVTLMLNIFLLAVPFRGCHSELSASIQPDSVQTPLSDQVNPAWYLNSRELYRILEEFVPFSCAKREASRNVTSLSASRSFLFPHRMITMFWLASILASLSHVVRALYVSRLKITEKADTFQARMLQNKKGLARERERDLR